MRAHVVRPLRTLPKQIRMASDVDKYEYQFVVMQLIHKQKIAANMALAIPLKITGKSVIRV